MTKQLIEQLKTTTAAIDKAAITAWLNEDVTALADLPRLLEEARALYVVLVLLGRGK